MNLFDVEDLFKEYPDFKFEFDVKPTAKKCGNETISWLLKNSGSFTATDNDHYDLLFTRNPDKEKKYKAKLIVFTTDSERIGLLRSPVETSDGPWYAEYDVYENYELIYNTHMETVFMVKRTMKYL